MSDDIELDVQIPRTTWRMVEIAAEEAGVEPEEIVASAIVGKLTQTDSEATSH